MKEFPSLIVRFSQPTEYDQAPLGTICVVKNQYFIQIFHDENKPIWQTHAGDYESAKIYADNLKHTHTH